jgi:16S rRNA processing protein RimM
MAEKLILVGRVSGAFGVKGEVRISTFTADPMSLGAYGPLLNKEGIGALTIEAARPAKHGVVARVREVSSPEAADALRGLELYVPRDRLPAPDDEDEYYLTDLIGLAAVSPHGEVLGKVLGVDNYGAGDLIEIKPPQGPAWLLAFTRDNVPQVRLGEGQIVVVRPQETEGEPT